MRTVYEIHEPGTPDAVRVYEENNEICVEMRRGDDSIEYVERLTLGEARELRDVLTQMLGQPRKENAVFASSYDSGIVNKPYFGPGIY
jgi:hypothetical protein